MYNYKYCFFIVKMPPYPLFFCTFTPENQYFIC